MIWTCLKPVDLGFLPGLIDEDDPRPVSEQLDDTYRHGGGWRPMPGFTRVGGGGFVLKYPGDPPMKPLAMAALRKEVIVFYPYSFLGVFQPGGSIRRRPSACPRRLAKHQPKPTNAWIRLG